MRALSVCLSGLILCLGACKSPSDAADGAKKADSPQATAGSEAGAKTPEPPATDEPAAAEIGANASEPCRHAMAVVTELDAMLAGAGELDGAAIAATLARVQGGVSALDWLRGADERLGRMTENAPDDVALIEGVVANLGGREQDGLRYDLAAIVTQLRAAALLELRRLLGELADAKVSGAEARATLDEAYCLWDGGLRALAKRADALPGRGGEGWEPSIDSALKTTVAALDNPTHVRTTTPPRSTVSRRVVSSGPTPPWPLRRTAPESSVDRPSLVWTPGGGHGWWCSSRST